MNFSILMSLYFKESRSFLNECFESIWINQTVKPDEIVLVLDGPIGTELQECVDYWKGRIGDHLNIIALPNNIGLGMALNEGLKHCSHDWVFRMDTDDICLPDRFEKQVEYIQKNPDVVLFSGQIIEFNETIKDATKLKVVPTDYEEIKKFALKRCPFNHMTVAYRRDIILGLGGYQHHLLMEDYNLWFRVIGAGYKVGNHSDVLLYARVGNGMYARRKGWQYFKSEKKLLDLKKELKLQGSVAANLIFLARASIRLIPSNMLAFIYNNFLRKNKCK